MKLRALPQGATLQSSFKGAVNAYDRVDQFRQATDGPMINGRHPTEVYPLQEYGDVQVTAWCVLMTTARGSALQVQRHRYPDGYNITEKDLPELERHRVYPKPMQIRSDDELRLILWQRSETDF